MPPAQCVSPQASVGFDVPLAHHGLDGTVRGAWYGTTEYSDALEIQKNLWQKAFEANRDGGNADQFIGLEHPAVVTLGSRGCADADLKSDIQFVKTDRGGQATLHSPGQLVIYPILTLKHWDLGVREFVELMQAATQRLLLRYGISSSPAAGAGLVTEHGKIAFIGLRVERGVTRHGLSLNVSNDLGLFQQIRSCGVEAATLDRVIDRLPIGSEIPSVEHLFSLWLEDFATVLGSHRVSQAQ